MPVYHFTRARVVEVRPRLASANDPLIRRDVDDVIELLVDRYGVTFIHDCLERIATVQKLALPCRRGEA